MKQSGKMWIIDDDPFFERVFRITGDKFEPNNLEASLNFVTTWDIAIDCGAHYGSWSRQMADRFKKIIAFEPQLDVFECLKKNTKEFKNIEIYQKAIGHKKDMVNVGVGKHYDNSGCSTVLGPGNIEMITIDSLNLDNVGYIKLDIEGYEWHALKGAINTIKKYKPIILFEDKGHSIDYGIQEGECGKFLESLGAIQLKVVSRRDFIYGWK